MKTIEQIISDIQTYKEDNPNLPIEDYEIIALIEANMEKIIEEIREAI
jgi:hypothetical protein